MRVGRRGRRVRSEKDSALSGTDLRVRARRHQREPPVHLAISVHVFDLLVHLAHIKRHKIRDGVEGRRELMVGELRRPVDLQPPRRFEVLAIGYLLFICVRLCS